MTVHLQRCLGQTLNERNGQLRGRTRLGKLLGEGVLCKSQLRGEHAWTKLGKLLFVWVRLGKIRSVGRRFYLVNTTVNARLVE